MTTNPIAIGFDWRQAVAFPEGSFQLGDQVRAEFCRYASDRLGLELLERFPISLCHSLRL
jgi:hypothetical protein